MRVARAGWVGLLLGGLLACRSGGSSADPPASTWLSADRGEQRQQLERQLRGFDVAMLEVGQRYIDLHWAGRDANWAAAAYQLGKLRVAIENGLERRPKRRASAQVFLTGPLPALEEAVSARDPELFSARFEALTAGCNSCHAREQVPFLVIRPPAIRTSPLHAE